MEPARSRAEGDFFSPRAGRLQKTQLHLGTWRMYRRSATTRLSSLQHALISDAKFLLRPTAKRSCVKFGNALPIVTAGGWATTFSCPTTYIFLRDLKSVQTGWWIGWRCGRAQVPEGLQQHSRLSRLSGSGDISIGTFDPVKATQKNGITLSKTPCGQGSSRPSKRGRIVK
jgi:hypothetical protein